MIVSSRLLIPSLQLEALRPCVNARAVRKALEELPVSVDSIYQDTLKRIDEQTPEKAMLGKLALIWLARARRPLHLQELRAALSMVDKPGIFRIGKVDGGLMPSGVSILSACCGLALIESNGCVRLIRTSCALFNSRVEP